MAAHPELSGLPIERLARDLAERFEDFYGGRPFDPRVERAGDVITFSFEGGLSPSDRFLLERGLVEDARGFRESFLEVFADGLGPAIEAHCGVEVRRCLTCFDAETGTTGCYFVVRERDLDGREERRRAMLAWGAQARRNSRELVRRHRLASRESARLAEVFRETEANLARWRSDRD